MMVGGVDFQTISSLASWLGASTVTMAFVQVFKNHIKIDPRILAYIVGFILVAGANILMLDVYTIKEIAGLVLVSLANAALVAVGAIGEHQVFEKIGLLK